MLKLFRFKKNKKREKAADDDPNRNKSVLNQAKGSPTKHTGNARRKHYSKKPEKGGGHRNSL